MVAQNKRLIGIIITVALMLLVPLIAMQFSNEVNWTLGDFVVAGALLFGTSLIFELIIRKVNKKNRLVLFIITIVVLLMIWAELAVGIFGTPLAGS